jgi:histidine ammonia-lyase
VLNAIDRAHANMGDLTLGIVGLGSIGLEIARRSASFGMRIVAVDPVRQNAPEGVAAVWTPGRLQELLAESEIRESHRQDDPRVQDAYSLRCMPQVHGAVRDALAELRRTLTIELNSATDNPLVLPGTGEVISGGNFHGEPLALSVDALVSILGRFSNVTLTPPV